MQTFISPIGFNTTSVTRTLLMHGLDRDDAMCLIRPATETDDERAAEAVADVKGLLQEIDPSITLDIEEVPHQDFETAVMTCSELISDADGDVVVSLSGGARDVFLPLTIAAMVHSDRVTTTYGYSDIDGQARSLPLPSVTATPSDSECTTLQAVAEADEEISLPALTEELSAVKSTITRHVSSLEAYGYLTTKTDVRTKYASITLSGRLYLAMIDA